MGYLMTANEFIKKIKEIQQHDTVYMLGTFGQPVTESLIQSKKNQLPSWYTTSRVNLFRSYIGKRFAFDCVGMIKAVLWGWDANMNDSRGGAEYASNGVADMNETTMINKCSGVSTNFANIKPGEVVWLPGHIGVYVGNNLVIECTPKWKNNVQYSGLGNLGGRSGYNTRSWTKHGKLPWIDYGTSSSSKPADTEYSTLSVDGRCGPATVEALQIVYETRTVDGKISGQPSSNKEYCYALVQGGVTEWVAESKAGGSLLIEARQEELASQGYYSGEKDGWQGPKTNKAIQEQRKDQGYYTGKIDGYYGPETCKSDQKWLNDHWSEWKKG